MKERIPAEKLTEKNYVVFLNDLGRDIYERTEFMGLREMALQSVGLGVQTDGTKLPITSSLDREKPDSIDRILQAITRGYDARKADPNNIVPDERGIAYLVHALIRNRVATVESISKSLTGDGAPSV